MSQELPLSNIKDEVDRLLERFSASGLTARLIGGGAIAQHRHVDVPEALVRAFGDIDLVIRRGDQGRLSQVMEDEGYTPNQRFNSLHGQWRLLFYDTVNSRQVDVFNGVFQMCHSLDLNQRLGVHSSTLSPADLLLTKLQVVQVNRKDLIDALHLIYTHEVGTEAEGDCIGIDRLVEVTKGDWGWYTTFTDNLARLCPLAEAELSAEQAAVLSARIAAIELALGQAPKSLRWKARAQVGRRISWYELPEEN